MKLLRYWKVILALVLVFAAGGVTGTVLTTWHFKHAFEKSFTTEHWTNMAMDFLQKKLHLTPEQKPKVRAITADTVLQFKASFSRAIAESGTNLVAGWRRTEQELTPEQRATYRQVNEKFRAEMKQKFGLDLPSQ